MTKRIGVTTDTITNWELNRCEPEIQCLPGIIDFLGYVSFSKGGSFAERLKAYRMPQALSQKKLARELGVDPTTVLKWEAGMSQPRPETREQLEQAIQATNPPGRDYFTSSIVRCLSVCCPSAPSTLIR